MTTRIKDFTQTKVGDKFASTGQYGREWRVVECERITPKRVVIAGWTYDKETGRGFGGERWSSPPCIYELTDEVRAKIKMERMRYVVGDIKSKELTDDQVERIYNIVKEAK